MFGYVRPLRDELKCKDFDLYRATYCGLCRTLRRTCGSVAPMILNYDFTFLALLLAPEEGEQVVCHHRCCAVPMRRCMCEQSPALERAAYTSVILAWWQLQDKLRDDKGPARLKAAGAALLLRSAYRRARVALSDFDAAVRTQLDGLHRLEEERCPSIDRAADTFARLLTCAAHTPDKGEKQRAMDQLLYHLGRWIYLIDARDDLERDRADGSYNPIILRYDGQAGADEQLWLTLEHSRAAMGCAAALLDFGRQSPLIENVLEFGLPAVQTAVFTGQWDQLKKQKIWRKRA